MKSKHWIILFTALLLLSASAYVALGLVTRDSQKASIYLDGALIDTIDLSAVEEPYRFTVNAGEGDHNEILVEPGQISISSATCPDQICVNHPPISEGIEPIVCLPNRLVLQIAKGDDDFADTVVGG